MENTPYKYYKNQLGIKIKYLTSDRCHKDSLKLISYNALYKRMKSDTCCERELRRASIRVDALITYNSLSREWKDMIAEKWGKPKEEVKKSWFAQNYIFDGSAKDFYLRHRYGVNNEKKLNLELVEKYSYNASVINTIIEIKSKRKAYIKAIGETSVDIWQSLSNDVNAFREVPHDLPPNKDSLRRKVTKYVKALETSQKSAYATIISGKLQNRNARKVASKEQYALIDELLAKHTNLDNQAIKSMYNAIAQRVGWKTLTANTIGNRRNENKLTIYAGRKGKKALKNNLLMQVKRKKPSAPMLYWTLDGWDVELMYQKTVLNKLGHKVTTYTNRLNIVLVLDPFNKYPIGYAIGDNESPELIKKALQNALLHTKELFGEFYKPFQLQSDNYASKKLTPLYKAVTTIYTPAEVGNAKAKVIEPYFGFLNQKYCKLFNNWSGVGVASGSNNQPNSEYLDRIKKTFPNRQECYEQIIGIIEQERAEKLQEFQDNFTNTKEKFKRVLAKEHYLLIFGTKHKRTARLKGEGFVITINGEKRYYDSFDSNFRKVSHHDWQAYYDTHNLEEILVVSKDQSDRYILSEKYIQPMAIADRIDGDTEELQKIAQFNKYELEAITKERAENAEILQEFFNNPALDSVLAKHLISDSLGQHKNNKKPKQITVNASIVEDKRHKKEASKKEKTFAQEQIEYYQSKININDFI